MNSNSLREEIAKRLWQIYIRNEYGITEIKDEYEYEYGVHTWTKNGNQGYLEEADEILELIKKRIDKLLKETSDYGRVDALVDVKEMLIK